MPASSLSDRVLRIQESATLAVSMKAKGLKAAGEPVIGFGAGEPDFPTPGHIVLAAQQAAMDTLNHHYSPAAGLPQLREAIADKTRRDSGLDVTLDQVLVTNGGKHALYEVFQTLLGPGDEALLPAPYWVSYPEQIRLAGAEPVIVPTTAESGYRASVDQFEAKLTERTRLLVFVSPSNPTGAVYPPDEVAAVGRWAAERGLWVITDEIYEHLVYDGAEFVSMPVVAPEIADRCVIVNGTAKSYAMTGWRVGWLVGPREVVAAATRIQSHLTSNVCNVAQWAAYAALTGPQQCVADMRQAFDRRRQLTMEGVRSLDGVVCPEPLGAFYAFPDCSGLFGRHLAGRRIDSAFDLADALLDVAKVALVPGDAFGGPGCVRMSYALGDDDLAEGLERIAKALG
ncbi:MAG: pyridoxal phosphate-dependent aminotransferase [Nitriliruptorales bacterium]